MKRGKQSCSHTIKCTEQCTKPEQHWQSCRKTFNVFQNVLNSSFWETFDIEYYASGF